LLSRSKLKRVRLTRADLRGYRLRRAIANDLEPHFPAHWRFLNHPSKLLDSLNSLSVVLDNDIAGLEACGGSRAVWVDRGDFYSRLLRQLQLFRATGANLLETNAQETSRTRLGNDLRITRLPGCGYADQRQARDCRQSNSF